MNTSYMYMFEIALLVFALSIDSFVACFAYGTNKIKIPFSSVMAIDIISVSIFAIALFLGSTIGNFIPAEITKFICFTILLILGLFKLFDSTFKSFIKKNRDMDKSINFSIFNLNFILQVYVDPEYADCDFSKSISIRESFALSLALSVDALAAGLGVGITNINYTAVLIVFFIFNLIVMLFSSKLGERISDKLSFDISWLSGLLLIVLAVLKIF